MTPILEVSNLNKSFGKLQATRDVTLDLRPQECHALIGPNGAGKSTLVNQVTGVLAPDSGRVVFNGADMAGHSIAQRARAGLGRTFQISATILEFSILENVALAAQATDGSSFRFLKAADQESGLNARAMATLKALNLSERAHIRAGDVSHGERRILELAMTMVANPKAILLDEPMAGLGKGESARMIDTLLELKQDVPLLLIEHDMDAVFKLADRVSVLVYGEIIATGAPDDIRNDENVKAAYLGGDAHAPS